MKENKSNIFIILVFISIITIPQIIFSLTESEKTEVSIAENRKLNDKPVLKLETITEYPQKFDNYYNDHLPFRTKLRELWTNMNYNLFNTTVDSRVVIGKEGWLFYRGNKSIEQAQGILEYSDKEKDDILVAIRNNVNELRKKGIKTYVLVAPNKENIYREYLPDSIPIKDTESRTEKLVKYIQENSDINIIYPKEELKKAKEKYQIYRKYDTHWNKIGAFIGTAELQKKIDRQFLYNMNTIKVKKLESNEGRDLANFASLEKNISEKAVIVDDFYSEVEYSVNKNKQYEEYISNSKNSQTVLFVGDSFREDMKPYFSKLYSRVIYLHRDDYTKDLIDKIKPDIVVIEVVERFSSALLQQLV